MKHIFSNRAANLLNLHFSLQTFGNSLGEIFFGVYLYQIGLAPWAIFLSYGGIYLVRFFLRPLFVRPCFLLGIRKMLIIGSICYGLLFFLLGAMQQNIFWLGLYIPFAAITDIAYWLPFHTYFAIVGEAADRGKQIAVREAGAYAASFLAPLLGAFLITIYHFWAAFILSAIILLLSTLPLLKSPDVPLVEPADWKKTLRQIEKTGFWLYCGDAIYNQGHTFIWRLVLFIFVGNYLAFGGLLSLAVLFQIFGIFTIGHYFDRGNGGKMYPVGIALLILTIIGRTFFLTSIPFIIFLDILCMLGMLLYNPVMSSAVYNSSKKSTHPLLFQFCAETGWDVGSLLITLPGALFLFLGGKLEYVMLGGICGLILNAVLLKKYFQK